MTKIGWNDNEELIIKIDLNDERFRTQVYEMVKEFFNPKEIVVSVDGVFREEYISEKIQEILRLTIAIEETSFYFQEDVRDFIFSINIKDKNDQELAGIVQRGSDIPMLLTNKDENGIVKARYVIKILLYKMFCSVTGLQLPWGCMTGVRPVSFINRLLKNGAKRGEIQKELRNNLFVTPEKETLALLVSDNQQAIITDTDSASISLYLNIPFCPTRCLYCAFTANPVSKYEKLIDHYINTMINEMEVCEEVLKNSFFKIRSIYMGGGTPTSINAKQLDRILETMDRLWIKTENRDVLQEYSVEAGRPDSITEEKLDVLKKWGVRRISRNPQTLNEETLRLIGRQHTTEEFMQAYELARSKGFDNINVDLIAGLPGEDFSKFKYTLDKILELSPENITIHTLSVKRASDLKLRKEEYILSDGFDVASMVNYASERLTGAGMQPYYMYRQKNMLGNLENVSYTKPGYESYYNVHIMEEDQHIIAFGSGGSSKAVFKGRIEKSFNTKSVEEYIGKKEEVIDRKKNFVYNNLVESKWLEESQPKGSA